ncbi:hypothetical protein QBC34DRAFT_405605 [Podospora aff. communis PSN243]|uniref:Translational machinery component n=1 Tax=Podospora aff. communis PSN243 TaxID=3040156 RepID=A0AAV9GMA2_9PEZI|nr:hypothetical protein QBC34DRAFT_405605 [Podospora aff. communis PSN243]
MSRFSSGRLLARNIVHTVSRPQFAAPSAPRWTRLFSQTAARLADGPIRKEDEHMQQLARQFLFSSTEGGNQTYRPDFGATIDFKDDVADEPHHFHVMCHRHNTHVTVTKPNRDAIISISAGNLGFKKSGRGTFDAGYQVTAYVIDKLHQMGEVKNIKKLEVAFRGFGQGREAAVKVLLGSEGKALKDKIIRVTDATRIKFGGTRGRNPRRL